MSGPSIVYKGLRCPACGLLTPRAHSVYKEDLVCAWCETPSRCGHHVYDVGERWAMFVCVDCLYPE